MKNIPVYAIDRGIPVPYMQGNTPLHVLEIGESFVFSMADRPNLQSAASQLKRKTGKTFTIRKQDQATGRIWRVS